MTFKIVQTIEDGQICLSIVPSSWESAGILYWPNNKALARKLQKQSDSVPDKTKWDKMMCIKKREFSTHKEAEVELEKMEAVDDTDLEETVIPEYNPLEETIRDKRNKRSKIGVVYILFYLLFYYSSVAFGCRTQLVNFG